MKRCMVFVAFLFGFVIFNGCNKESEIVFSVVFEENGGDILSDLNIALKGDVALPIPVRTGYRFLGWYADHAFSGEKVEKVTVTSSGNLTLYARWEKLQYLISFESNGGETIAAISYRYEDSLSSFAVIPVKIGHTFAGWYLDSSLTIPFNFLLMPSYGFTLYAAWNVNNYTITFDSSGGSVVQSMSVEYNENLSSPSAPLRFRYTFLGWYSDENLTMPFVFNKMPAHDVTLHAKWLMHDYSIDFYTVDITTKQIAFSQGHSLLLLTNGKVYAWGKNTSGQLGNGTFTESHVPIEITSYFNLDHNETIEFVQVGETHSFAVSSLGRIFAWGNNTEQKFGTGMSVSSNIPLDITFYYPLIANETIINIQATSTAQIALTNQSRIISWGYGMHGELGNGEIEYSFLPMDITHQFSLMPNEIILKVSSGSRHSLAYSSNGRLFVFGDNTFGQLGTGDFDHRLIPTDITARFNLAVDEKIIDVAAGLSYSVVLTNHGRIFTFGVNESGQLGNGTTALIQDPTAITNLFNLQPLEKITRVYAGFRFTYATTTNGRVFGWGENMYRQLGDGTTTPRLIPTDLTQHFSFSHQEFISVMSLGEESSAAITNKGRVFVWGNNGSGRLGNNSQVIPHYPIILNFPHESAYYSSDIFNTIDGVSLYPMHRDGYLFSGWFTDIQLTSPYIDTAYPSIHQSLYGTWNIYDYPINYELSGGTNHPDNPMKKTILSGEITLHEPSKEGHQFTGWYTNSDYSGDTIQTLLSGTIFNQVLYAKWEALPYDIFFYSIEDTIIDIKAGTAHVVALSLKNQVYVWGDNQFYQLGNGNNISQTTPQNITSFFSLDIDDKIVRIYVGYYHSMAISEKGRIFMWGENSAAALGIGNGNVYLTPVEITSYIPLYEDEIILNVEMGYSTTIVLTSYHRFFSWGANSNGMMGDGGNLVRFVPYEATRYFSMPEGVDIVRIAGGKDHLLMLGSNGHLYAFGSSDLGVLGVRELTSFKTPHDITSNLGLLINETITHLYVENNTSYVQTSYGRIIVMGIYAQIYTNTYLPERAYESKVVFDCFPLHPNETIITLYPNNLFTYILTSERRLFVVGDNYAIPLLQGADPQRFFTPYEITDLLDLDEDEWVYHVSVSTVKSTYVLTSKGRIIVWGSNSLGQLGNGTTVSSYHPIDITFLNDIELIHQESRMYNSDLTEITLNHQGVYLTDWYQSAHLDQGTNYLDTLRRTYAFYVPRYLLYSPHIEPIE